MQPKGSRLHREQGHGASSRVGVSRKGCARRLDAWREGPHCSTQHIDRLNADQQALGSAVTYFSYVLRSFPARCGQRSSTATQEQPPTSQRSNRDYRRNTPSVGALETPAMWSPPQGAETKVVDSHREAAVGITAQQSGLPLAALHPLALWKRQVALSPPQSAEDESRSTATRSSRHRIVSGREPNHDPSLHLSTTWGIIAVLPARQARYVFWPQGAAKGP